MPRTRKVLAHAAAVGLRMTIKCLHLSSPKARIVSYDSFDLLQMEKRKCGPEGRVTGKRRQQHELSSQTQVSLDVLVRKTKDGHHSR